MQAQEITNEHGIKFYIEQSGDFDDVGRMTAGRGWYAGIIKGNDQLSGVFFDTQEQAIDAVAKYKGGA